MKHKTHPIGWLHLIWSLLSYLYFRKQRMARGIKSLEQSEEPTDSNTLGTQYIEQILDITIATTLLLAIAITVSVMYKCSSLMHRGNQQRTTSRGWE